MAISKKDLKKDTRTVPTMFRAVERNHNPDVYFGHLVSEDGFNIVAFCCHDGEGSHFKERVLAKHDFVYSKLSKDDLAVHVKAALYRMERELDDSLLLYEAAKSNFEYASKKSAELL